MLHRVVRAHLETYLALAHEADPMADVVPDYVEKEFRSYLKCGILAHGFARARCSGCGHEFLVAFSCKGRGVFPSCNAKRMAEAAAHLVDYVTCRPESAQKPAQTGCGSTLRALNVLPGDRHSSPILPSRRCRRGSPR